MAKAAFSKKKTFHQQNGLISKKKLVKCYILSIALDGAETWALKNVDQKQLEVLKGGGGEGQKINWNNHVRNELLKLKNMPSNALYYNIKFLQLKHWDSDL